MSRSSYYQEWQTSPASALNCTPGTYFYFFFFNFIFPGPLSLQNRNEMPAVNIWVECNISSPCLLLLFKMLEDSAAWGPDSCTGTYEAPTKTMLALDCSVSPLSTLLPIACVWLEFMVCEIQKASLEKAHSQQIPTYERIWVGGWGIKCHPVCPPVHAWTVLLSPPRAVVGYTAISCLLPLGHTFLKSSSCSPEVSAEHAGWWGVEGRKTNPAGNGRGRLFFGYFPRKLSHI